jgi:Ni2+-binding GTPase involved in maturation of urease and hydrogenase
LLAVPPPMTPRQRRPPAPFPLTNVTGFLGAGKTSLLNALLRDPALAGTLVIVNEFGEIGLDHLLVERLDGAMLVMTSGCLCCSIRGDLIATLEDILRRRDNGRIAPFQRVLIETTGLAAGAGSAYGHGASLSHAAVPCRRRRHLGRYGKWKRDPRRP